MEGGHAVGGDRVRPEVGEEEPSVVADQAAGAEGEGEAADPPADGRDREVGEDLRDHGARVLAPGEADLEEREPGLHEHHQTAGDDHPHRVDPDRGSELSGDRLLEVRGVGQRRARYRHQHGGGRHEKPGDRVPSSHPITLLARRRRGPASRFQRYRRDGRRGRLRIRYPSVETSGPTACTGGRTRRPFGAAGELELRAFHAHLELRRVATEPLPGAARVRAEAVEELVGMQRVVVEEQQPAGLDPAGEGERVGDA